MTQNAYGATPTVSIITAVYNGSQTLPAYFSSVFSQTYPDIEVIVIDGGSTDGSVEIIERHADRLHYWISEPDRGIYDAWNKGVKQASGKWIAFIGCDDQFVSRDSLANLVRVAEAQPDIEFASARARILDENGELMRVRGVAWNWLDFRFKLRGFITHQGALHHRSLFERYGEFDIAYPISGDYDFLLRAGKELNAVFLPETILSCGHGNSSINAVRAYREVFDIQRKSPHVRTWEAVASYIIGRLKLSGGRMKHRVRLWRRALSGATA